LSRQITGRVRWSASLLALAAAGTRRIIEAGPGRTLARVARELLPDAEVLSADELLAPRDARGAHPLPGSTQP
jgi:[acyl-carrier-protein] S-malonyltransferase